MEFKSIPVQGKNMLAGISIIVASLSLAGCTKNFEKYNTDPTKLSPEQTLAITLTAYAPLEQNIYSNYQTAQNLSADEYAGYGMTSTGNFYGKNSNYGMNDGWNKDGFISQYNNIMAPINNIAKTGIKAKNPDLWAVLLTIEVEAMHRVTDKFGPIAYTKAGSSLTSIPYDDQKTIYQTFFKQLDTATTSLNSYIAANPTKINVIGANDLIYGGDYKQWLKFANSLRLRLAMHIVKVDATTAQQQAEIALKAPGGLLEAVVDNAAFKQTGSRVNDLWQFDQWGDNSLSAAIGTYLTGYNDPRAPIYSAPAKYAPIAGKYVGIRLGANNVAFPYKSSGFANYNSQTTFTQTAPQLLMTAAEIWFLKSEAALRGWNGYSAADAKTFYEKGITISMQQWGVPVGNYINDNTRTEAAYTDPLNPANNSAALSDITIQWDPEATQERSLERIITQKWLAMFPEGQEAWTDFRRTGYPKLFPVLNNASNGAVDTQIQIRRIPYPADELSKNPGGLAGGVKLLGGPDNGGTRLWWDVNKANF
ncbi:SusD/RagB family nutrient-binding outer membrane lipoprotein [Mucilaginibacter lappiensis]|uniref:Susd and RagB outer membrane lipoprotein n=1 Tax=Mucilaginibacter lappiensis TaxID=354630 RepID=A0A841JMB7_9SPHI|nr:SusD/RagB family nutrient-binding outer membrane lipoprotein [Mucilaginibacter lappiensis]MBB6130736.1 hypothetical protein [Mucilaginibacter lappiensis]